MSEGRVSADRLLPGWAGLPMITPAPSSPACEPHTPHPAGYLLDVDWTADMETAGYAQRQCSGCGRWLIWEEAVRAQPGEDGNRA